MRLLGIATATAVLMAVGSSARAQQTPDDFTPEGYTFCGWKNLGEGTWTMSVPEPGAWMRAFARGMTCRDARRNVTRVRYTQQPPFRPVRLGYRCKTLDSDHEYLDVRCVARTGKPRRFRWQTGS